MDERLPGLKTLELPFSYEERGERKLALVKVVLCDKCCGKLMWKRRKEKEKEQSDGKGKGRERDGEQIGRPNDIPDSETRVEVKEEEVSMRLSHETGL